MNKELQKLIEFINSKEELPTDEKSTLIKSIKSVDSELAVTAFKLERTEKVKRTTGILLEETIEELEKKRKAVEEQNRELEIATSLEKVRAVAMGMDKSDDLLNICQISFKEFQNLGFSDLRNAVIHIPNDEQKYFMDYDYSEFTGGAVAKIEYGSHPIIDEYLKKIRSAQDAYFEVEIGEDQLEDWKEFRKSSGQINDPRLDEATALYYYLFSIGIGDIGISTFKPIDDVQVKILKRFRNVFDLAYRRYIDIKNAEAQAREAQIEAAMEKVRARAMSMQKPDELKEVVVLLRKEMGLLGIEELETSSIYIVNEETTECWYAIKDVRERETELVSDHMTIGLEDTWVGREMKSFYESVKQQKTSIIMKGENRKEWINYCASRSSVLQGYYGDEIPERTYHLQKFTSGYMGAASPGGISNESWDILQRATSVFSLAYTRFKDLQQALARENE
ncbi:MAG: hypothetical protein R3250_12015, partial [Melioribacteraceae bacterium]|nr:hypothetical protein [Melioribacteraceae bacterium]